MKEVLAQTKDDWLGLVGTLGGSAEPILRILQKADRLGGLVLLVGPEGGLTEQEQSWAQERGYRAVFLGENILRVETAAIGLLAGVKAWKDNKKGEG